MKIEIKLDDSNFCYGCPYLDDNEWNEFGDYCRVGYDIKKIHRIRPQECKDKYGE